MRKIFSSTSAAIFGLLLHLGASVGANAQPAIEPGSHSFPQITLPDAAHGEQAIRALGQHLPDIAQAYGKSVEQLTDLLGRDRTLHRDLEAVERLIRSATLVASVESEIAMLE